MAAAVRLRLLWRLPGSARGLRGGEFARPGADQERQPDPRAASSLTLWRLLRRSRSAGELLRWLPQNAERASGAHYALALRCLLSGAGAGAAEALLRHPDFQAFGSAAARAAARFENEALARCLWAAVALGLPERSVLVGALRQEAARRQAEEEKGKEELLAAVLASPRFFERRQERFVRGLADWLPGHPSVRPSTMALLAKYLARHRLRETQLLDCIAAFLLERVQQLDSKVTQRLVFPFSRMNYRPSNHAELFPQLEVELERKAAASPLATVNILMSLFQLHFFPLAVLRQVFSPAFLSSLTSSPCGTIVCRYLSFLDSAVSLEIPDYEGPRLAPQYRVSMFDGALTADETNRKYSYKGLVGEALRQLVGGCYQQDEMLHPGYRVDFLLRITSSGKVLPIGGIPPSPQTDAAHADAPASPVCSSEAQDVPVLGLGQPLGTECPSSTESPQDASLLSCPFSARSPSSDGRNNAEGASSSLAIPEATLEQERVAEDESLPSAEAAGALVWPPVSCAQEATHAQLREMGDVHSVVLSINDSWHYCHNSSVLVGSRAMCHRHLQLLGYHLVQLPYLELESLKGIQEVTQYLSQKLSPWLFDCRIRRG